MKETRQILVFVTTFVVIFYFEIWKSNKPVWRDRHWRWLEVRYKRWERYWCCRVLGLSWSSAPKFWQCRRIDKLWPRLAKYYTSWSTRRPWCHGDPKGIPFSIRIPDNNNLWPPSWCCQWRRSSQRPRLKVTKSAFRFVYRHNVQYLLIYVSTAFLPFIIIVVYLLGCYGRYVYTSRLKI